ncbi:MAG: nickel-dependent lactate racemase, partial [Planctomycetota bacterium]|nr:nickel-dependent lactate racemase [Planctomycetota bacterium]
SELAKGKNTVLIVCDDVARPTPAYKIIPYVLEELAAAGVPESGIEFMMALGAHRPMTKQEIHDKVGGDIYGRFAVHNHEWNHSDALEYMGKTSLGVEVWINKKVARADLVIGIGRIMPIEICGFTGGGKILIPGCCGEITNGDMHWNRVDVDSEEIIGKRDNPIRKSIDELARKAGLDFIVNVIMDAEKNIFACVAGDLIEAHREGCLRAKEYHEVRLPQLADIVVVDGYPFDIEFWQVNKALDAAGMVVRKGGVIIVVSPCYEGLSQTHEADLLKHGYKCNKDYIKKLVESGRLAHKVVGMHMIQVSDVAVEKAAVFVVTSGISREKIEKVGLNYAKTPQKALKKAFELLGQKAKVTVLRGAAEMLPVIGQ